MGKWGVCTHPISPFVDNYWVNSWRPMILHSLPENVCYHYFIMITFDVDYGE